MEYNPKKLLEEAKNRVKNNNKKKSFIKSLKKITITLICTGLVAGFSVFLGRLGIDLDEEQKSGMIKLLVEIIIGGGLLGFLALFGIDATKVRNSK